MQPFPGAISHFEVCRQPFDIFDDIFIQKRDAKLETVRHGELVRIHQELIRKSGSHLQELEPAELVGLGHEILHARPAIQYGVTRIDAQQPLLKQIIDLRSPGRSDKTC